MHQIEIHYFWPLTQQVPLDLDFTPSETWILEWRKRQSQPINTIGSISLGGTGATTWLQPVTNSFVIKPSTKNVGKWEISDSMFVYRPTKPNALIRFMAKYLLGFKWHDEI
jgi:hypothetical protein